MCGIAGKVVFNGALGDRELIHAMCETLIRRGPDAEGIYASAHIGLGQRRLAVIDIDHRADPPISNEDGTVWIVFNGEIYNYRELTRDLIAKGHTFRTQTDTEAIVHLYEEHGFDCIEMLDGMFAFAVWDSRSKLLFAARDRFGKKPFFYALTAESLIFGSAIRALMKDPSLRSEPNFRAIDAYLSRQCVPSPESAFVGINKLPAGHYLVCDVMGKIDIRSYWSPPAVAPCAISYEDAKKEVRLRLAASVRARLIADVPLGALLSGGIDSGLVVALMAEVQSGPVRTFSIGFQEQSHNELPYARQVAERYGTRHDECIVEPDVLDVLPLLVREYNEPFADSSAIPSYYVSQIARQHVTVALTGDGGDESFAGYEHYRLAEQWGFLDSLPAGIREAVCCPIATVIGSLPYTNLGARLSRGLRLIGMDVPHRYLENTALFKREEKLACYSPKFKALIGEVAESDQLSSAEYRLASEPVDWMMQSDQRHYLPDCLMVKADVASMANSLELRSPFLDHHLVNFASTIPLAFKRTPRWGKRILRDLASEMLPADVAAKKKTGFGIPLAKWLRTDLLDLMRTTLMDGAAKKRGLFHQQFVARMIHEHVEHKRDWSTRLWALMWLELWFREFVD